MRKKYNKGDIEFLWQIIFFLIAIFVIWVLTNGPKNEEPSKESPFIKTNIGQ